MDSLDIIHIVTDFVQQKLNFKFNQNYLFSLSLSLNHFLCSNCRKYWKAYFKLCVTSITSIISKNSARLCGTVLELVFMWNFFLKSFLINVDTPFLEHYAEALYTKVHNAISFGLFLFTNLKAGTESDLNRLMEFKNVVFNKKKEDIII